MQLTLMYNAQNAILQCGYSRILLSVQIPISINHLVTVVGWDDNYSAKNFKTVVECELQMVHGSSRTAGEKTGEKMDISTISYQDGSH